MERDNLRRYNGESAARKQEKKNLLPPQLFTASAAALGNSRKALRGSGARFSNERNYRPEHAAALAERKFWCGERSCVPKSAVKRRSISPIHHRFNDANLCALRRAGNRKHTFLHKAPSEFFFPDR